MGGKKVPCTKYQESGIAIIWGNQKPRIRAHVRPHIRLLSGHYHILLLIAEMPDSKVKDMGLAEFGRKELTLAEHEMPGL